MDRQRVCIVTDGATELRSDIVRTFGIRIVPRRFEAGRNRFESNEQQLLEHLFTLQP